MRIDLHIHTEDTDIFRDEKKDFSGQIHIPETNATFNQYGLTHDINRACGAEYVLNCIIHCDSSDIEKIVDWIYMKIRDKAKKLSVGDLNSKYNWFDVNKEEMKKIFYKWINI
jgi:hypothetical protein